MKSIEAISRHRDNLRVCMALPCGCRGTEHEEACHRGMMMMKSTAETLSWLLGENEEMQELVDRMDRNVQAMREAN